MTLMNGAKGKIKMFPVPFRRLLPGRKRPILLFGLLLVFLGLAGILSAMAGPVLAQAGKTPKQSPGETDAQRLIGRWVRPDGGYILELREVHKDGGLSAAYFNPRPIKVSQAVWTRQEGKISVLVELRDVNYPGSNYNLEYIPESDRLQGTYFQALERQWFDVQFMRSK